jgi:hypothetical protein
MAGGYIAGGDRHEAREPRFRRDQVVATRVEAVFGNDIADRQQPTIPVEKKIELHGVGHGAGRRFDRLQPALQRRDRRGVLRDVAPMALERPMRGFDPEQHVGARIIAPLTGERTGKVASLSGVQHQLVQSIRQSRQLCRQVVESADQLARRDEVGAPVVGQSPQRFARERQAVARAGDGTARIGRIAPPRSTSIGERDQVPGQVAAIDR